VTSALATALGIFVVFVILLLVAGTGRPNKMGGTATAVIGFAYAILMLASLTGAGLDLFRAVIVVLVVGVSFVVAVAVRTSDIVVSAQLRAILAIIVAAALIGLVSHMLSLLGWIYVAAATVTLTISTAALALVGGERGIRRVNRWSIWLALIPAWLLSAGLFFTDPGALTSPAVPVSELSVGLLVAMVVVVLALATSDPLLHDRIRGSGKGFPLVGLVFAVVVTSGTMLAALLLFGGSFLAPAVSTFMLFTYVPVVGPILLALATFVVITVVPGYLLAAADALQGGSNAATQGQLGDADTGPAPGIIVAVAVAVMGLALLVSAPTVLLVAAGVLAAGAMGAATLTSEDSRQSASAVIGTLTGLGLGSIWGIEELFTLSWGTVFAVAVAIVVGRGSCFLLTRWKNDSSASNSATETEMSAGA
jgi:hypothetical protein